MYNKNFYKNIVNSYSNFHLDRKLKAQAVRQHGIGPRLFSSATAGQADVIITLSYFSPTPEQRTSEQCQDKSDIKEEGTV